MARPRKNALKIQNLYVRHDRRTNKIYYQYKHPVTGKFHGLGSDKTTAEQIAISANQKLLHEKYDLKAILQPKKSSSTVKEFYEKYLLIQEERLKFGEIRPNTVKQKIAPMKRFVEKYSDVSVDAITVKNISELIELAKSKGDRMAQVTRSVYIDFFTEAQRAGEVQLGFNPATATRKPFNRVKRARLTLEVFNMMLEAEMHPQYQYIKNALLLALLTGQRAGDISKMKWEDIKNEHLLVEQQKTGFKVAIPLKLKLNVIDKSLFQLLAEIDAQAVKSDYIIHFSHATTAAERGSNVSASTLSTSFKKNIDLLTLDFGEQTQPSFHEIRSLSERLYREQGVDTKILLGHKSQRQTDRYNDNRSIDYQFLTDF